ncbi:MAG: DUF423 domain-containing protein [Deltaproteobacteria bacterium]|nr:DUF423 domain-containing protein [Deltaproteobacteria bacterium]
MGVLALRLGALNGFISVALGAFGAHGLKKAAFLGDDVERAARLAWWQTAGEYQMGHALLLVGIGLLILRLPPNVKSKALSTAALAIPLGLLLFSGSLYVMTLTGLRVLGAVTPFGGLALLTGWICLFIGAKDLRSPHYSQS